MINENPGTGKLFKKWRNVPSPFCDAAIAAAMEERQHGDILEHHHENYDYWHPVIRVHNMEEGEIVSLPEGHILAPVVPEETPKPRGLQVQPFDWASWDAGCHAEGICQGYHSIQRHDKKCPTCHRIHTSGNQYPVQVIDTLCIACKTELEEYVYPELHHRAPAPEMQGIAEAYWQCPHCRPLQKLVQLAEGARLETYDIETRGNKVVFWLKVSSGQWYVVVTYGTIQRVASLDGLIGTAYAVGNYPPQQMPDEIAVCLARRFWHKMTKGHWSSCRW